MLIIPNERIINKIYLFRGKKVMLDRDLAELYGVATKVFNQAVRRNSKRFPEDFMFQLNKEEFSILKSQFVTSSWGGIRKLPLVFTEQGIGMLSSVLNTDRAIMVNIQIIRTFTKLQEMLITNEELRRKIEDMEKKYDQKFAIIFDAIKKMISEKNIPKTPIGFKTN